MTLWALVVSEQYNYLSPTGGKSFSPIKTDINSFEGYSQEEKVFSGDPQDTFLGPRIFPLYVTDTRGRRHCIKVPPVCRRLYDVSRQIENDPGSEVLQRDRFTSLTIYVFGLPTGTFDGVFRLPIGMK